VAAGIQKAGGSAGLAFAILLAAPATNIPSLLLLVQSQSQASGSGTWLVVKVIGAITSSALLMSYIIDGLSLDLLVQEQANGPSASAGAPWSLPEIFKAWAPWMALALVAPQLLNCTRSARPSTSVPKADCSDQCMDQCVK